MAARAPLLALALLLVSHGHCVRAEEEPCATPAELSAFVATGTAGSISLCPKDDMREDLGTLTVHGQQRISVVGRAAARATHPPRFFGRFVLDDMSRSELLLKRVTIRDRNSTATLPGCDGPNRGVFCAGAAVWVGAPATLTATHSTFSGLSATDGGAIYSRGGTVLLRRVVFFNAHAVRIDISSFRQCVFQSFRGAFQQRMRHCVYFHRRTSRAVQSSLHSSPRL